MIWLERPLTSSSIYHILYTISYTYMYVYCIHIYIIYTIWVWASVTLLPAVAVIGLQEHLICTAPGVNVEYAGCLHFGILNVKEALAKS